MKNYTKKQHHIPVMILKRFSDNAGMVYILDVERNMTRRQRPKETGFIKHLYSMIFEDKKDDLIEKAFSKIESENNQILDKLLIDKIPLTELETQKIIEFTITLMLRSPQVVKIADEEGSSSEMADKLRKISIEKSIPKTEVEKYITDINKIKGFSYANTLSTQYKQRATQILENYDAILCKAKEGREFILSDRYITILPQEEYIKNQDRLIEKHGTDWWKMPIEIACPLSKTHALVFVPKSNKQNIGTMKTSFKELDITIEQIDRINHSCREQKDGYLYASNPNLLGDSNE